MNRMKTCSYNIRHGSAYLREIEEVEDGVEGEVEVTHNPFEDLKEKLKIQQ